MKFTQEQALQVLIQAADIAIEKGAFSRKQVVDIDSAINTFTAQAQGDSTPTDDLPHQPNNPKP